MTNSTNNINSTAMSPDFPTLTEAARIILTPDELQNLRRNLTEEKIAHAKYLREHPEINAIMQCAMRQLLLQRPENPVDVLLEFFAHNDLNKALQIEEDMGVKRAELVRQSRGLVRPWPP